MCGVRTGRKLKAVIPGGTSMKILPAEVMMNTNMDYNSIAAMAQSTWFRWCDCHG